MTNSTPTCVATIATMTIATLTATAPVLADQASPPAAVTPESSPLIPRDVLFGNPERANVQISPDGGTIAYLAPNQGVLNIWVQPRGEGEPRAITSYEDRPVGGFSWAWNGEQILFGRDKDGDENTHIHVVDVTTGDVRDLTPIDGVKAMIVQGDRDHPDEVIIGLNDRDARFHDYYLLDTKTGEKSLVQLNDEGHLGYFFDNSWNTRGRMAMQPDGGMRYELLDGDEWKEFLTVSMEDSLTTQPMGFNVAGDTIYALDSRGRDTSALVAMPATVDGAAQGVVLHESVKADVGGVLINPDTRVPEAAMVEYLREDWTPLNDVIKKDLDAIATLDHGDFSINSRTADDRIWILSFVQDAGPIRYWIWDRDAQTGEYLFSHRPELEDYTLATMAPVEIQARDGLTMTAYLTRPVGATEATPMVLLVHGGPWSRDSWGFNSMHQWLANRGYAVLSPNFRSSTGFGKNFLNAGNREWYGAMQDDLVDATNWAVENGVARKDKIAIMGGSYGGYATLAGLTRDPELYAAGVDIVGPSHVATLLNTIPPYWVPILKMFETRVGSIDEPVYLDSISPLTHVDRIVRPLLIVQGANDPKVKLSESNQIVEAMQSRNLPVTYMVFPDEGHGMVRPENTMAFNAVTEEFLAKHLGGRIEPMGDALAKSNAQIRSKGNLMLEGVDVWTDDESEAPPAARQLVELSDLTAVQQQRIQQAIEQMKTVPAFQLQELLSSLEARRSSVPAADRPALDYLLQKVKARMVSETPQADGTAGS